MSGSQEDWRVYRGLRNRYVSAQRKDRQEWEEKKLSSTNDTPAQLWKSVKGIVGGNSSGPPTRLFDNEKYINSLSGLATTMNKFFSDKVMKLRKSIPVVEADPLAKLRESMSFHI